MKHNLALAAMTVAVLTACGGGGSSSNPGGDVAGLVQDVGTPSTVLSISGVAATGAAVANANVAVTNSAGHSVCTETLVTTTALGAYSCTLKAGEAAPFFVVVTDPTGAVAPLVSVSTATPTAGTPLSINVTTLTTAIVGQLASDGNALTLVRSGVVNASDLSTVTRNVVAQLAPVLSSVNLTAYDPFTTRITAATSSAAGNTADVVLDLVKIVTDPATGRAALSTIESPTPVMMASAGTTAAELASSQVSAPSAGVSDLGQAQLWSAAALERCFALPAAQRVLARDTTIPAASGGPAVTQVAAECGDIVADTRNAAGVAFLNNGYSSGQVFYSMLSSDAMTGARFSAPEILAFYPSNPSNAAESTDRAVFNFRYLNNQGTAGNIVVMGRSIPGTRSAARPTSWWLTGNQQTADVSLNHEIRRVQQFNPLSTSASRFQSGLYVNINTKGPGSVDSTGASLTHARVKGPGLPATGLVFVAPAATAPAQSIMDLADASGRIPAQMRCGVSLDSSIQATNCPVFWLASTSGLSNSVADRALAVNPAHASFGQPGDGSDMTKAVKGAVYTVELFYGNQSTPGLTVTKTAVTDLVQPQHGASLPWHSLGAQSTAALDLADGNLGRAQVSLGIDWLTNAAAQPVSALAATADTMGSFGLGQFVPKGALSAIYTVPGGGTIPALGGTAPRALLFQYQMTDNTRKSAVYAYN